MPKFRRATLQRSTPLPTLEEGLFLLHGVEVFYTRDEIENPPGQLMTERIALLLGCYATAAFHGEDGPWSNTYLDDGLDELCRNTELVTMSVMKHNRAVHIMLLSRNSTSGTIPATARYTYWRR